MKRSSTEENGINLPYQKSLFKYRLTQLLNLKITQKWENFEQINSVIYNFSYGKHRTKINDIGSIEENRNTSNQSRLKDNWKEFKKAKKKNGKEM